MRHHGILFILIPVLFSTQLFSQSIDHWETVIREGDTWKYLIPTSEPQSSWTQQGFDDSSWAEGSSGFGYGDGDDNTEIPPGTISIYLRKQFDIVDLSAIEEMLLNIDYDDAFVAYLNGVEIARSTISGSPPLFDQPSDGLHEASLYQGLPPESFIIHNETITALLAQSGNILAVQAHNQGPGSSDLSAIPVLSVGLNNTTNDYFPVPPWFRPPLEFTSSDLPIIVIDSRGQAIINEPKVMADIGIIYNGSGVRNNLMDPFNELEGFCGIELRGESSLGFPKNSYSFEMWDSNGNDIDTSFLDFPSEEDFVLHGPYSDKSLLNNVLAMKLANDLGHYSSRTRLVELVINNEYKGVYAVMERIKRDAERVDIATLRPEDIDGDQLTGGYIIRIDKGENDGWESIYSAYNSNYKIFFQYFYPDENDIQPQQKAYIQGYMQNLENAMWDLNSNEQSDRFIHFIDLRSFVDNYLLNELSKNVDAYRLSTYFYKDRDSNGGKLIAGPYWDFNLAFGNGDYCGGDDVTGWEYYQCVGSSPFWWDAMLRSPIFRNATRCRWDELRQNTLNTGTINAYLDSMTGLLSESQERNFQKWPILGTYVWPNSWFYEQSNSHQEIMSNMKSWIQDRSEWMDNNLAGSAESCELYDPPYNGLITAVEEQVVNGNYIHVYPNPTIDVISVESNSIIHEVTLSTVTGKIFFKEAYNSRLVSIDRMVGVKNGLYLMMVETENSTEVKKVFFE